MRIRKRQADGRTYYYLEHSIRDGGKVRKIERYLGTKVPADIDEIKVDLAKEADKSRRDDLDRIKHNYARERKKIPKSIVEKETRNFAIKFTYDTQKIEGSTLTLRETANLLEHGIAPKNKPMRDVREAEAHMKLFYDMLELKKNLDLMVLLDWHWSLFKDTKPEIAGEIRRYSVGIGGSAFLSPSPVEVRSMLAEFFEWYGKNKDAIHPVDLAALVHLKFVTIHTFGDGNGRIARLLMNHVLHSAKFPMMDIPYEKRNGYYRALERAQVNKDESIFVKWLVRRCMSEHSRYLK